MVICGGHSDSGTSLGRVHWFGEAEISQSSESMWTTITAVLVQLFCGSVPEAETRYCSRSFSDALVMFDDSGVL